MTHYTDGMMMAVIFYSIAIMGVPGLIALAYEWYQDRMKRELKAAKPAIWHLRPAT